MRLPIVVVMVESLGFLAILTLVGTSPIPQSSLLFTGSLQGATAQPTQIKYETILRSPLLLSGPLPVATAQLPQTINATNSQSPVLLPGPLPVATAQPPQITKYETISQSPVFLPGSLPVPTAQPPQIIKYETISQSPVFLPGPLQVTTAQRPQAINETNSPFLLLLPGPLPIATVQPPQVTKYETISQPPVLLPGSLPVPTAQPPQIIKYETDQGLKGYSFRYELTDGTARREGGELEDGIWIVFWGAEWVDDWGTTVKIVSDQTGVSWSIMSVTSPFAFAPLPHATPVGPPFQTPQSQDTLGFEIDLKKDQEVSFIQGCKDIYDKNGKIKGISCRAKASLVGGSSLNFLRLGKPTKSS